MALRHFLSPRFAYPVVAPIVIALGVLAAACSTTPQATALQRLHPCATGEAPPDAYCGSLRVYENRQTRTGRQIDLRIVLLPAVGNTPRPDPLFFLAGGPGQAAAQMASELAALFQPIQRDRDIILVDQRGTGKSHPLNCPGDDSLHSLSESDDTSMNRLRHCLEHFDADVRQYTTPNAMDDLDDVRTYLGYERINLYGVSYGTRAALVYLRRHPSHVRTITLDGVAPMNMHIPLFAARDAQQALDRLLHDCDADASCRAKYPGLAQRVRALVARVAANPPSVRLKHPRTGIEDEVVINDRFLPSVLLGALYSPTTASVVPALIARAEQGDFQGLAALAFAGDQSESVSVGMQLSILCSEDAPRLAEADVARQAEGTVFGMALAEGQLSACRFWPRGQIDASYYQPVVSDVPALVLSGGSDPVTPPRWGADVASHLRNSRHVIVPASGHGVITTPCGAPLVASFIERGSAASLDTSCVERLERPPFFITPAGPDPAPVRKAAE